MKVLFFLAAILNYGMLFSQELSCVPHELYDSEYEVMRVISEDENELADIEYLSETLQLVVIPDAQVEFPRYNRYKRMGYTHGFKLILLNNTSNNFVLSGMDGRVIMQRQVFYKNEWRNVESFDKTPKKICGNSLFHKAVIKSGEQFLFAAPCIDGNIQVKFRFAIGASVDKDLSVIYSNEFEGYINESLID